MAGQCEGGKEQPLERVERGPLYQRLRSVVEREKNVNMASF